MPQASADPVTFHSPPIFTKVGPERTNIETKKGGSKSYTDSMGRAQYEDIREYANMRGYSLTPKFVFIDGRTGAQIHSEAFYEEALYNEGTNTPALSSYFELMDKLMPGFLNALSTQRIRGTRTLLIKK